MKSGEKIHTYKISDYWSDIGTLEQYRQSNFDALDGKIFIEGIETKRISEALCILGENCEISPSAVLKGKCIIGNNCKIKANAIVEDSILWENTEITSNCYVKNCMFAKNSVITSDYKDEIAALEKFTQKI